MKKLLCLVVVLSYFSAAHAEEPQCNGFRGMKWGTPLEDVKSREPQALKTASAGRLTHPRVVQLEANIELADMDCTLSYVFLDEKLAGGFYTFTPNHYDDGSYVHGFRRIRDLLVEKYGPQTQTGREDSYPDYFNSEADPRDRELMTKMRNERSDIVEYWDFPDTENPEDLGSVIIHILSMTDNKVQHRIYYQYKNTRAEFENMIEERRRSWLDQL